MKQTILKINHRIIQNIYRTPLVSHFSDLTYQALIEKHLNNLPSLPITDLSLVEALKSEKIVVTSLAALSIPSTPQMLKAASSLISEIPESVSGSKHDFTIHATPKQIMEYSEIFLWGLQQRLLNIAENYIGLPVAYHGSYFRRDLANGVQKKSRLWHLDKEDRKVFKIIIYLNDVYDDGGPFQYIPYSFTSAVASSLRYNYEYIQNQTMQQVISPLTWKSCTGISGTVIIADTANIFHRGTVPTASDRFTIFFDYSCRSPKHPFYYQPSLTNEDLAIIATKLSEHQRQCVFWRSI
ncbi:2OG-Fe(II) oxygenase [Halotia branconii]|uniref:2OG-Fe(II) oxygenase n=1 Tax=Halotia branconii CENA392 TaxID=1539056 RepID=A0AAJ6NMT8_9CYAN|nr:2OG-Fe(II) oxygenase [Halotia branconii]WGV23301.1 2OG-Fe(II) oxygenase [Halotia branconii CENA392]